MMEGVVVKPYGTGKSARLKGYTAGGKTGSAQIFDPATKHYTHFYNGSFVGFAPVTRPRLVVAVTLNRTKLFGGVVAGPVFKTVAQEALRLLDIPRDLPDAEPPRDATPAEENDVSIAEFSDPPDDLLAPGPAPEAAPAPAAGSGQATATVLAYMGPTAPNFQGKPVREVLEESLASGVPVDVIGSGIARGQIPAAGSPLTPGSKVRVLFQ
jgi:cell division protein FtsI (penicillin-binding protein 3)